MSDNTHKAPLDAPTCSPSSTPETDKNATDIIGFFSCATVPASVARKLERECNAMRAWIMQAAPMLSVASCIVIDEAVYRLDEIAGCRAVLEMCPVDFTNLEENVKCGGTATSESRRGNGGEG